VKEVQIIKREGVFVNRGGEVSLLATLGWPWKREKKRAFNEEVGGSVWSLLEIWEKMEFWEIGILVDCGGRKERK